MKKRYGMALLVVLAVMTVVLAYLYQMNHKMKRYEGQFLGLFDTVTEIKGYAKNEKEFSKQMELLKEKLEHYNKLYDIYHNYEGINNMKTINDNAGIQPVKVDSEIINLLKFSREMYDNTNGQINVAYGSVLKVWHEYRTQGIADPKTALVPPLELLSEKAQHSDISQMLIDEEASTVFLADPEMALDVGSIGKGYAVQRLGEYAREMDMVPLLISVGGNVCTIGQRLDGTKWRLGVQNPDMQSSEPYIQKVDLMDTCIVTSGDYQRYYEVDGKRYSHIIDPDTMMPAEYFASVSILAADSGMADALSTSIYNMDFEEGRALIESMPDIEAMWIFKDGSMHYSSGFENYIVE